MVNSAASFTHSQPGFVVPPHLAHTHSSSPQTIHFLRAGPPIHQIAFSSGKNDDKPMAFGGFPKVFKETHFQLTCAPTRKNHQNVQN